MAYNYIFIRYNWPQRLFWFRLFDSQFIIALKFFQCWSKVYFPAFIKADVLKCLEMKCFNFRTIKNVFFF